MISRQDYTDEEWAEVIARCKLLTEEHQWEYGEWCWDINNERIWLIQEVHLSNNWIRMTNGEMEIPEPPRTQPTVDMMSLIWLPRLDQLLDLLNQKVANGDALAYFIGSHQQSIVGSHRQPVETCQIFRRRNWDIENGKGGMTINIDCVENANTPEIAVLRVLQRCEEKCTEPKPDEWHCEEHDTYHIDMEECHQPCAGIHPTGDPHRCLNHATVEVKV